MALRVQLTSLYWHDFSFFYINMDFPFFLNFSTDVELEHVSGDLLGITSTSPCTGNIPQRGGGATHSGLFELDWSLQLFTVCLC